MKSSEACISLHKFHLCRAHHLCSQGMGWLGGTELWQFLLDNKALSVIGESMVFSSSHNQSAKRLWGRAMCPASQSTLYTNRCKLVHNCFTDRSLLQHAWSTLSTLITIRKRLSWWQQCHIGTHIEWVPKRSNELLVSCSKLRTHFFSKLNLKYAFL
jgi:hypothetical protein